MRTLPRVSSPVTYILILTCILWMVISGMDLLEPGLNVLIKFGAHFQPITFDGEEWRLLSSLFLHYGMLHLVLNCLALLFLGRSIEPQIGSPIFLGVFLIGGLAGNLASSYWNLFTLSLGASGAIFGLFGFDLMLSLAAVRNNISELLRVLFAGVVYVTLILLIGQLLPFDNMAHAGGLAAGILMGLLYSLPTKYSAAPALVTGLVLVLVGYLAIPEYQVTHYRQFLALKEMEEHHQVMVTGFTSDASALKGYRDMQMNYDRLAGIFRDSLGAVPESLRADRYTLSAMMENRSLETAFKVKLLEQQSYRYLDSIEWAQRKSVPALNHPLSFDSPAPAEDSPRREIAKAWYDEDWKEIMNPLNAAYYRLGFKDSLGRWHGQVEDYFLNGAIQMKGQYNNGLREGVFRYYTRDSTYSACGRYENELRTGRWEFFHENGRVAEIRNFTDDNYLLDAWAEDGEILVENGDGEVVEYHSNGEIRSLTPYDDGLAHGFSFGNYADGSRRYEEIFENGTLVQGRSYQGNTINTYDRSVYYPFPSGGMENFEAYVSQQTARSGLAGGEVKLLFICPPSGELYDIRVWKSFSARHDRVAMRILENGPAWIPAREHGLDPVTREGTVTISFNE